MSIGVGYTEPFKLFCADWINAEELSKALNDRNIPGLMFRPIHIKPFYSTGKGENYQGVEVYVTDKDAAPLSLTQFYVMEELARLYPEQGKIFDKADPKRFGMFDKVCGSKEIRRRFAKTTRCPTSRTTGTRMPRPSARHRPSITFTNNRAAAGNAIAI